MDIRTRVTAVLTAGILAAAPIIAFALPNYTLNGNYTVTGTLQVNTLNPSQCVATNASRVLISSGAACGGGGGGGVTSVDSTNANLLASPDTGAVLLTMIEDPTFTGTVTAFGFTTAHNVAAEAVTVTGLASFQCVETGLGGILQSSGAACGGGVTSVTAGPSGNQTFAPTTGAVVGDIVEDPTFTGAVTDTNATYNFYVDGSGTSPRAFVANQPVGGMTSNLGPDGSDSIAGVLGTLWAFSNYNGNNPTPLVTMDTSGDIGATSFSATNLTPGNCLQATTNGEIIDTGSACGPSGGFPAVQQLHGNQSITAVAAACTPGTPIVFAHTFSAVPDILMSTSAVVGDTAAPETGTITTTGFTPELCSIASAIAATVYWQAVN